MVADAPGDGPPATLPVAAAGIPDEVRALPQFVVWAWEFRDHRWCKPPLRADGLGYAASNDARTWASCDEALAAYQRRNLAGIGFAIASDDPFVFIDLDDCRDPQTGDVDPWAVRVLDRFRHTYHEVSPSATGFKILGRGTPPNDQHVHPIAGDTTSGEDRDLCVHQIHDAQRASPPGAPAAVRDAQAALDGLYTELFPREEAAQRIHVHARSRDTTKATTRAWSAHATHAPAQSSADSSMPAT